MAESMAICMLAYTEHPRVPTVLTRSTRRRRAVRSATQDQHGPSIAGYHNTCHAPLDYCLLISLEPPVSTRMATTPCTTRTKHCAKRSA